MVVPDVMYRPGTEPRPARTRTPDALDPRCLRVGLKIAIVKYQHEVGCQEHVQIGLVRLVGHALKERLQVTFCILLFGKTDINIVAIRTTKGVR